LRRYLDGLAAELAGSSLRVMQSSGGLTDAGRLRGPDAILSGPAGGVVAFGEVARRAGFARAIGFDMGGTSTDVSCVDGGAADRVYEMEVAGVAVRAPALDIKTVAAGGGSLCRYSGLRLTVGPDSAGADPGPICYRRGGRELTVADVDLALGRVVGDRFPFPLEHAAVDAALAAVADEIATTEGRRMSGEANSPSSRTCSTATPEARSRRATRLDTVVLPLPSMPSKTTNMQVDPLYYGHLLSAVPEVVPA
jgi:5-oxoprolinase (ATP-hydrolysing)